MELIRSKIRTIAIAIAAALLVVPFLLGMSGSKADDARATEPVAAAEPVAVSVADAVERQVSATLGATGNLVADEQADVAPQASGQVVETPVRAGDRVAAGAVLARLDDRDARARLQKAQAAAEQARTAVTQARARLGLGAGKTFDPNSVPEVRSAYQTYQIALAEQKNAEANEKRYAALVDEGVVSKQQYDEYHTKAETARAQAESAREQYETAKNTAGGSNESIASAEAALRAAEADLVLAQKAVDDTVVRAPFSGLVSDRPVSPGEYVTPSSKVVTLLRNDPIRVSALLPESDAGRVHTGTRVSVTVAAYPDRKFSGTVTAINPALDAESRSVVVEARIENGEGLLNPNMFATVAIPLQATSPAVFVPADAVQTDESTGSSRLYVVEGGAARVRVVRLGAREDGLVQIVSGVEAGASVATGALDALYDGAAVAVK